MAGEIRGGVVSVLVPVASCEEHLHERLLFRVLFIVGGGRSIVNVAAGGEAQRGGVTVACQRRDESEHRVLRNHVPPSPAIEMEKMVRERGGKAASHAVPQLQGCAV